MLFCLFGFGDGRNLELVVSAQRLALKGKAVSEAFWMEQNDVLSLFRWVGVWIDGLGTP